MQARAGARGQALLETVIVMPVLVFLILGAVQLVLIAHARVMTEYAAFCAARAGIVHNGDWNVMRNAALIAALPIYERTDDLPHFLAAWAKVKAAAEITEAVDTGVTSLERLLESLFGQGEVHLEGLTPDVSLVEVNVTSPSRYAFEGATSWQTRQQSTATSVDAGGPLVYPTGEIDFDDVQYLGNNPEAGRLAVQVRVLYPLRIPFVSRIFFELWLAQRLLDVERVQSDLQEWVSWQSRASGGEAGGGNLSDEVAHAEAAGPVIGNMDEDDIPELQWADEIRTLRLVGEETGIYFLPLKASYAMQTQSNFFRQNRRQPAWFDSPHDSVATSSSSYGSTP